MYGDKFRSPQELEIYSVLCCWFVRCSRRSFSREYLAYKLSRQPLTDVFDCELQLQTGLQFRRRRVGGKMSVDAFGENLKVWTGIVFTSHSS